MQSLHPYYRVSQNIENLILTDSNVDCNGLKRKLENANLENEKVKEHCIGLEIDLKMSILENEKLKKGADGNRCRQKIGGQKK